MREWIFLIITIITEVLGSFSMKLSNGFHNFIPSVLIFVFYGLCFTFFTLALKKLELSLCYAIWSGLGTVLIAAIGMFYFGESVSFLKIISIILIVAGVIGLNLSGAH